MCEGSAEGGTGFPLALTLNCGLGAAAAAGPAIAPRSAEPLTNDGVADSASVVVRTTPSDPAPTAASRGGSAPPLANAGSSSPPAGTLHLLAGPLLDLGSQAAAPPPTASPDPPRPDQASAPSNAPRAAPAPPTAAHLAVAGCAAELMAGSDIVCVLTAGRGCSLGGTGGSARNDDVTPSAGTSPNDRPTEWLARADAEPGAAAHTERWLSRMASSAAGDNPSDASSAPLAFIPPADADDPAG